MRTLYRIVYKDGTHSAWTRDYNWAKKNADFFKGRVEMKTFRSIQDGRFYFNIKTNICSFIPPMFRTVLLKN